ncbi:MAG: alpha/beta hydrolase [Thermoplasmataceae archaeon]
MINETIVNLGGSKVFYRSRIQPGNKVSIILLHGRSFTSEIWIDSGAFEKFAELGMNIYAPDYPGFGNSTDDNLYKFSRNFKNSSKFVFDFASKLGLDQFMLMGASMGGGIALRTIIDYPELVSSAIVVGAAGVGAMRDELAKIGSPLLIIWGENDDVIKKDDGVMLKGLVRNSDLEIIDGATHAAYLDNPQGFFDKVASFVERQKSVSSAKA